MRGRPAGTSARFTFDEPQIGDHRPQQVPGKVGRALKFNGKGSIRRNSIDTQPEHGGGRLYRGTLDSHRGFRSYPQHRG